MRKKAALLGLCLLGIMTTSCDGTVSSTIKPTSEQPISSVSASTTVAPTLSSSTGESIDMSKYPHYKEDWENLTYSFGEEEIANPFWQSNVVYNETVLLTKDNETGEISGKLQFTPKKIIAVKDYTLKTSDYALTTDYTVEGNRIVRTENSTIPYLTPENISGEEIPEGYVVRDSIANVLTDVVKMGGTIYSEGPFWYGNQIQVTYVYDIEEINPDLDMYPSYNLDSLPKTKAKLTNKEGLKIAGIGDSVLEGCSSSKHFNREPFLDNFLELTRANLASHYDTEVILDNQSVGGKESGWGAEQGQLNKLITSNPDLLFVHFGINDLGSGVGPSIYEDNILTIVSRIRTALPDCEIVLLSPFGPNPMIYDYLRLEGYTKRLQGIADDDDGTILIDVFSLSQQMYKVKSYQDMTGNGINHVNDYASRVYLSAILSTFYEF